MTNVLAAAALYFAVVFGVGFVLGPIRVLLLEPRVGSVGAVAIEAPFLLGAMVIASRIVPRALQVAPSTGSLLSVGIVALALQQIADLAVGVALRGIPPLEQVARLATPEGMVYAALLVLFATMPLLTNHGRE